MFRILHSRFFRCLVCFILICCILVASSPFRVQATSAGLAGVITGAASVSLSAPMVIGATLIALGLSAGINGTAGLEAVVDSAVSHLESAGTYIKDGCVELLQTVNSAGEKAYYVAGEMMDDLRSWVFDTGIVTPSYTNSLSCTSWNGNSYLWYSVDDGDFFRPVTIAYTFDSSIIYYQYFISSHDFQLYRVINNGDPSYLSATKYSSSFFYLIVSSSISDFDKLHPNFPLIATIPVLDNYVDGERFDGVALTDFITDYDLSLGYLPSQDTELDDQTIVAFHPYLANVIKTRTGGSGGSGDEPENKWWLSLAFAESLDKLYETTQQFQIETPSVTEIPDIQVGIEYDITEEEDEDGDKYFVLDPVTTPGTGTDPGTGTNPDTGEGTDPDTGTNTDPDTGNGSGDGSGSNTGSDSGGSSTGNSWSPPSNHNQFALADLSKFFPFCIPFDLFDFFQLLNADPVAPVLSWEIHDLAGQTYSLTVDLSEWDSVAQLFRRLQLFLFVSGLAAASRKYIKW